MMESAIRDVSSGEILGPSFRGIDVPDQRNIDAPEGWTEDLTRRDVADGALHHEQLPARAVQAAERARSRVWRARARALPRERVPAARHRGHRPPRHPFQGS